MAVIEAISSKANLKSIIKYVIQENKTNAELITGKDCLSETCLEQMLYTKECYHKTDGREYLHIIQSFDPTDNLTAQQVHDAGLKLADAFKGFQALVATHIDKAHLHNHLIINSVSFETGYKIQMSKKDLQQLKEYSDKICLEIGASVIPKKEKTNYIKRNEYRAAEQGKSWKFRLISAIDLALSKSSNKEDFIQNMNQLVYEVNWTDTRKYITYTTPEGYKCRDNKLYDEKYLKGAMENELRRIEKEQSNYARGTSDDTNCEIELLSSRTTVNGEIVPNGEYNTRNFANHGKEDSNYTGKDVNRQYTNERKFGKNGSTEYANAIFTDKVGIRENSNKTEKRYYPSKSKSRINSILHRISTISNTLSTPQVSSNTSKRKINGYRNLSKQAKKEYLIEHANASSINWEENEEEM